MGFRETDPQQTKGGAENRLARALELKQNEAHSRLVGTST